MNSRGHKSGGKNGFLFVGNELILDFVNTCPVAGGRSLELLTDFDALLRWFRAADLVSSSQMSRLQRSWRKTPRAQETADAMRKLRDHLRAEILAWERGETIQPSTVHELNRLLAQHPVRTRLSIQGTKNSTTQWFKLREPKDLFGPLANSAAKLFTEIDRKRVRKCGVCVLHFRDTSKRGTRRWCSMRLCGNRVKVAAYAARHPQHKQE